MNCLVPSAVVKIIAGAGSLMPHIQNTHENEGVNAR